MNRTWIAVWIGLVGWLCNVNIAEAQVVSRGRSTDTLIANRPTLQRGTVAALGTRQIDVAGRGKMTVSAVATELFQEHDAFTAEVRRVRPALLADPVVSDEVIELDRSTIFRKTTAMAVVDPAQLRTASPTFARVRKNMKALSAGKLEPNIRSGFEQYRKEIAGRAGAHPLKQAAGKGEQAFLDAIASGLGDFAVTMTVEVPKNELGTDANGKLAKPKLGANGKFEQVVVQRPTTVERVKDLVLPSQQTESGECEHEWNFLAGFTRGKGWDWSWAIDLGFGEFEIGASAYYAYGLRIPIEVHAKQTPKTFTTKGETDTDSEYEVELEALTKDAPEAFYKNVGLPASDVHDGKELVLEAGVSLSIYLKIVGVKLVDTTFPKNPDFDFGQNFKPPFGDCGTNCGFDVWIPADVTRSTIRFVGVTGSARVGVKVAGDGEIQTKFEGLVDGKSVDSWFPGAKKEATKAQVLSFEAPSDERRRKVGITRLASAGGEKRFGYRLSGTEYEWNVDLIPGVRGDIDIDWKIYKDSFTIGPYWLSGLKLDLGTFAFGPHAGTTTSVSVEHGKKQWSVIKAVTKSGIEPPSASSPVKAVKPR